LFWILIGLAISIILKLIIRRIKVKRKKELARHEKTILALVLSIIKVSLWFYVFIMVLSEFSVNIVAILSAAGILLLAVGLGAQEMIKDFIAGFFIIFEHTFDVDDIIQIGDFKGVVLEIGLRRTKLKNPKNEVRIINNADIRLVTNFSLDLSVGVVDVIVPKSFAYNNFKSESFNTVLENFSSYEDVLVVPTVTGVITDDAFTYTLRITFKAENNTHIPLERDLREKVIEYIRNQRST